MGSSLFDEISTLDGQTRDRLRAQIKDDPRLTDYQKSVLRTLMLTDGDIRNARDVFSEIVAELEKSNYFAQGRALR